MYVRLTTLVLTITPWVAEQLLGIPSEAVMSVIATVQLVVLVYSLSKDDA